MTQTVNQNQLEALIDEYILTYFQFYPPVASYCGLHEYDGKMVDLSKASIATRIAYLKAFLLRVNTLNVSVVDKEASLDKKLLVRLLEKEVFDWEDMRGYATDPMYYGFVPDVSGYIKRDYAPLAQRLEAVVMHMESVPKTLAEGRANLEASLPLVALETAITMYDGLVSYYEQDVNREFEQYGEPNLTSRFIAARDQATVAIKELVEDLKSRLPQAHQNYAIGPEKYRKMLLYGEAVDMSLEEVLEVGERNLAENQAMLRDVAGEFAPGRSLAEVMSEMTKHHPTPETMIPDTVAKLEEVRQFLIDHEIVTVPSEVRCIVAETPPFMRWGFAFMDPAGPFEQHATEAYYYITPVEPDWTPQQQEEWLTKFDYYTLQDVSIHEAYPGHYLHFLYGKLVQGRLRQLMMGAGYSYSFVEGWAHYTEQMMIDEGYGAEDPRYHLAQLSEALLRNARYIVSLKIHTQGMTVEEGTRFIMENAYMEETPALSEARRGTFDPGYLNYCLGKLLILKLREDYRREKGDSYSLKEFHNRLLSYGAPPIPYLRPLFLQNDDGKVL